MDIFLLILSFVFVIAGIIGSVLPIIPGPLTSWLGLFIFSYISNVEVNSKILVFCFVIALIIFVLDNFIPIYTSKKFGASKYGIIGASIGTLIGLFLPPFGIIFGAAIGAIVGELILNKNFEKSLKAAAGVLLGIIVSGFTKALISIVFLIVYIILFLKNFDNLF